VRALYGPWPVTAGGEVTASVTVPPPAEGGRNPALVAFVQDGRTGEVLQSLTMRACGGG
jgi:hypothetical protein